MLTPWKERYNKSGQCIKKQRHYFANDGSSAKAMVFPVVMYGCESWSIKKAEHWRIESELWCWRRLGSSFDCKINSVSPKGNQSWIFIGRTDAKAEAPILWPPDAKSQLIRKDPDAGKDWWQEEKGMTEDEMVGWHHQLNGHEYEQAMGDGGGQGSLACCSIWVPKELDMTNWLNNKSALGSIINEYFLKLMQWIDHVSPKFVLKF